MNYEKYANLQNSILIIFLLPEPEPEAQAQLV